MLHFVMVVAVRQQLTLLPPDLYQVYLSKNS